ncbi:MAG: hypothetical protein H0T46_20235 [Deltaproteobacteria bacterium]|nr:hypothetical protein [Deltaproteobacteria bacterium]
MQVMLRKESSVNAGTVEPLMELSTALREHLGLQAAPEARSKAQGKAKHAKNHYEGKALGPVLELAEIEARKVFAELVERSGDRDVIIEGDLGNLDEHLTHAAFLLASHDDKMKRAITASRSRRRAWPSSRFTHGSRADRAMRARCLDLVASSRRRMTSGAPSGSARSAR